MIIAGVRVITDFKEKRIVRGVDDRKGVPVYIYRYDNKLNYWVRVDCPTISTAKKCFYAGKYRWL